MKKLFALIVVTAVGFVAGYAYVAKQKQAEVDRLTAAWTEEKSRLQAALEEAENRPVQVETVVTQGRTVVVPARPSPEQILQQLKLLRPGDGAGRNQSIRKVVFHLETLAEIGAGSLPAIREFLALNEDLNYGETRERDEGGPGSQWRGRGRATTDFVLPPSLRIGLFDVLGQIGGSEAEAILAEVLETTGRGVEVAYVARILEERAPGQYRELALAAAKDLLLNPPPIDHPNRLDENAKSYLYGVLAMFNDMTFAWDARQLLVEDGRLDRSALRYLSNTLEDPVPALYEAYKDPRLTNQWDKASIAGPILEHVGLNEQANALFYELVMDDSLDSRMRALPIIRLAGGEFGPFSSESPTDPAVINERMRVLAALETTDERLARARDATMQNLERLSQGEQIQSPFGGGDRGGDRSRGRR